MTPAFLLAPLLAATPLIGYFIASKTTEELAAGKKWFMAASIASAALLLVLAPWWAALIAVPGFAFGWLAGLAALLMLLFLQPDWALACLTAVLGVLLGTRWRADRRSLVTLLAGCLVVAALGALLPQLI
jgi:hypothetical protein